MSRAVLGGEPRAHLHKLLRRYAALRAESRRSDRIPHRDIAPLREAIDAFGRDVAIGRDVAARQREKAGFEAAKVSPRGVSGPMIRVVLRGFLPEAVRHEQVGDPRHRRREASQDGLAPSIVGGPSAHRREHVVPEAPGLGQFAVLPEPLAEPQPDRFANGSRPGESGRDSAAPRSGLASLPRGRGPDRPLRLLRRAIRWSARPGIGPPRAGPAGPGARASAAAAGTSTFAGDDAAGGRSISASSDFKSSRVISDLNDGATRMMSGRRKPRTTAALKSAIARSASRRADSGQDGNSRAAASPASSSATRTR